MSSPIRRYQVFISSTYSDLREAREKVFWQLLEANFTPVGMENFSATDDRGWKTIERTIDLSDYYVVIAAGRYGTPINKETNLSWTEREYNYARKRGMKVHAFLRDMAAIMGAKNIDEDRKQIEAFRERLQDAHLVKEWKIDEELKAQVVTALYKTMQEDETEGTAPPGWYRGPAPDVTEFSKLSAENRDLREKLTRTSSPVTMRLIMKRIPIGAKVVARWPSQLFKLMYGPALQASEPSYNSGAFFLKEVNEDENVFKLQAEKDPKDLTHFPLDKVESVFPTADGTWSVTMSAWY